MSRYTSVFWNRDIKNRSIKRGCIALCKFSSQKEIALKRSYKRSWTEFLWTSMRNLIDFHARYLRRKEPVELGNGTAKILGEYADRNSYFIGWWALVFDPYISVSCLLITCVNATSRMDNFISSVINNDRRCRRARPYLPKRINWIVFRNMRLSNVYRGLQKKKKTKKQITLHVSLCWLWIR